MLGGAHCLCVSNPTNLGGLDDGHELQSSKDSSFIPSSTIIDPDSPTTNKYFIDLAQNPEFLTAAWHVYSCPDRRCEFVLKSLRLLLHRDREFVFRMIGLITSRFRDT